MTEQVVIQVRDKIHEGKLKPGACVRRSPNGKTPGIRTTRITDRSPVTRDRLLCQLNNSSGDDDENK